MAGFFISAHNKLSLRKFAVKNKKWLLVVIIAFPSLFWLILETSTINSRRLPFYGPKTSLKNGDTAFYTAPSLTGRISDKLKPAFRDTSRLLTAVCFLSSTHRHEGYRLAGMWEYLKYKREKIAPLPVVLVAEQPDTATGPATDLAELGKFENVTLLPLGKAAFHEFRKKYFDQKPYYIDSSFFVLVDAQKHIRGYYDGRYASEIKRLLEEFQHLKLKEVKKEIIETNEIRTEN